ncbi:formate/nitrite transporter family protein [Roseivivax isoporae]|uniref:Transporter (Formate/nitrite transporter family protein) n=1 Tax=Roseivivax isoporae LMG 25204 TaxID=1449351 RepID=X7FCA4_9RHOB|nr:formate/nitrite transporter family protein [Roseivivax isoporae]ETX29736.1 transporter (formate/nitrite transporter family protein) [Roseivivax isoporae LMG 25204]
MTERPEDAEPEKSGYSDKEVQQIDRHRSLSPRAVYEVVSQEGREEILRPLWSLWWSGIAAGIGISASVLSEGILHQTFLDHPYRGAIENMGYTVGFILVILGRLQLFTENTITVVLPVLKEKSLTTFGCAARLWAVVFAANLLGTAFVALLTVHGGTVGPEYVEGMKEVGRHFAENSAAEAFKYGVPAGFFIAAIVWMLPSSEGFEIFVIFLFTYLIAMGDFTHVVAGSHEAFLLWMSGEIGAGKAWLGLILPSFAGNVLGGTGLFALLAYGQVAAEIGPARASPTEEGLRAHAAERGAGGGRSV